MESKYSIEIPKSETLTRNINLTESKKPSERDTLGEILEKEKISALYLSEIDTSGIVPCYYYNQKGLTVHLKYPPLEWGFPWEPHYIEDNRDEEHEDEEPCWVIADFIGKYNLLSPETVKIQQWWWKPENQKKAEVEGMEPLGSRGWKREDKVWKREDRVWNFEGTPSSVPCFPNVS